MTDKYKLSENTKIYLGKTLYQIEALKDFGVIKKGDLGGYIESTKNLSQNNNAWVYDNAKVYDSARIYDNAKVFSGAQAFGNAKVTGNAVVAGNARVTGNARVNGNVQVSGGAKVFGNAEVYGYAQVYDDALVYGNVHLSGNARVFGNARLFGGAWVTGSAKVTGDARVKSKIPHSYRSDGYSFIVVNTKNNKLKLIAGCRYFSKKEAIAHWTKTRAGTQLGEESIQLVKHLFKMAKIIKLKGE